MAKTTGYTEQYINGYYKKKAKELNELEYTNTRNKLILMRLSTFKWNGLPDTCNERMLEMSLLMNGFALFADVEGSIVNLNASVDGSLNIYGDPVGAYGTGLNGYNKHFNVFAEGSADLLPVGKQAGEINAVLVKDNDLAYPFINVIEMYARRLADVQRSIDVITAMLKAPAIIVGGKDAINKMKIAFNDVMNNNPALMGIDASLVDTYQVLDTGVKTETLTTLKEYYDDLMAEYAEYCGINSNPSENKKERLIVPEVEANDQQTNISVASQIKQRKAGADRCNEFWKDRGLNISCELAYTNNDGGDTYDRDDITTQDATSGNTQQRKSGE